MATRNLGGPRGRTANQALTLINAQGEECIAMELEGEDDEELDNYGGSPVRKGEQVRIVRRPRGPMHAHVPISLAERHRRAAGISERMEGGTDKRQTNGGERARAAS